MTDPYKTAFNIEHGVAITEEEIVDVAVELRRLKQNWNEQEQVINELKKDLNRAISESSSLEEQTNLYVYKGARKAYTSVMNQINDLGI